LGEDVHEDSGDKGRSSDPRAKRCVIGERKNGITQRDSQTKDLCGKGELWSRRVPERKGTDNNTEKKLVGGEKQTPKFRCREGDRLAIRGHGRLSRLRP